MLLSRAASGNLYILNSGASFNSNILTNLIYAEIIIFSLLFRLGRPVDSGELMRSSEILIFLVRRDLNDEHI